MTKRIDGNWRHAGLAPPRRLGTALSEVRLASGTTLEQLASRQPELTVARLESIERGAVELDDHELGRVAELYGVDVVTMVPPRSRLIVDLDEGILRVDGRRSATELGEGADRQEVLSRYLALVYSMREIDPGSKLTLRVDDLDALGKALRVGERTLVADLESLMRDPADLVGWRYRLLNRKVLLPAAGILVSFCGAAALVLVPGDDADAAPTPSTVATTAGTATSPVDAVIGTAAVQERNTDGSPGPVRVRGAGADDAPMASTTSLLDATTESR